MERCREDTSAVIALDGSIYGSTAGTAATPEGQEYDRHTTAIIASYMGSPLVFPPIWRECSIWFFGIENGKY